MFGAEHHGRNSLSTRNVVQWGDRESNRNDRNQSNWERKIRSVGYLRCKPLFFLLLIVHHGPASRYSRATLHQNLMHGITRTDAGCTVDALPKVDEDFEALREMSLP